MKSLNYRESMSKINIAYVWSLRNAAADKAGQHIDYQGELRYMKSPLEFLVEELNEGVLGDAYNLVGIIYDDDASSANDQRQLQEYGYSYRADKKWFYPAQLQVQGRRVNDLLHSVPSSYRQLPRDDARRVDGKRVFEAALLQKLRDLKADVVLLDGLLVILDDLVRPGAPYYRKIFNIHPGITRIESPYERRGAYATLDALHGARGKKVVNWKTMESISIAPVLMTGASFHYVDNGIDSGEVIADVLQTVIDPEDTILELRWNNFNLSLFPALQQGLAIMANIDAACTQ